MRGAGLVRLALTAVTEARDGAPSAVLHFVVRD
jgi:hypothetical protein